MKLFVFEYIFDLTFNFDFSPFYMGQQDIIQVLLAYWRLHRQIKICIRNFLSDCGVIDVFACTSSNYWADVL